MTPDEQRMLTELASKIAQTPAPPRDPEAEAFIRSNIGNRPDALYLMTQTILIQNMALQQAQNQIRDLQQQRGPQAAPAGGGGSFLGGGPAAYAPPQQQSYSPAGSYAPPSGGMAQGGAPSFLRGAATTAAGVAAGALAFEGIRSLFSHPGYGMGSGFGGAGLMGGDGVREETIVNNYYDSPEGEREGHHSDRFADASDIRDDDDDSNQDDDSNLQDVSDDYDDSNGSDDDSVA